MFPATPDVIGNARIGGDLGRSAMDAGPGPGSLSTSSRNANEQLDWHFLQCFGERTPGEEIQDGGHLGNVV